MDSASLEYPYPSEVNVGDLVSIKLSQTNYVSWKSRMFRLIESHGLDGFINGKITPPPQRITIADDSSDNGTKEVKNPDYEDWQRSDGLLKRWILAMVSEVIYMLILRFETAKDLWTALEEMFEIGAGKDLSPYLPLHKAAINGDWKTAESYFQRAPDPDAIKATITGASETALAVAVRSPTRNHFVKKLVDKMSENDFAMVNDYGSTALHIAASSGNTEAAKLLVEKNTYLLYLQNKYKNLPLHVAAARGKRDMVVYLMKVTREDDDAKPFEGESGVRLVQKLIDGGLYDIALNLVKRHSKLAFGNPSPLEAIAQKQSAFRSGARLNYWQCLLYWGKSSQSFSSSLCLI
ncbi:unnamed protein product [Ilex paraguariensis]|uniref:Retrotransposon Copia-like N-terminal domain-containing protein n=1 Tax=Ilex paraguariensis TaxID=185542 RepID=A0ABC8QWA5_9AQUA